MARIITFTNGRGALSVAKPRSIECETRSADPPSVAPNYFQLSYLLSCTLLCRMCIIKARDAMILA